VVLSSERRRCRGRKAGAELVCVAVVVIFIAPFCVVSQQKVQLFPGKRGINCTREKKASEARTRYRANTHTHNTRTKASFLSLSLSQCPRTVLARRQKRPGTTTKTVRRKIKSSVDGNTITWRRETRSRAVKKPRRRSKSVAARRRRGAVAAARRPWRKKSEAKISLRESWNALKTLWRSWRIA